ncbi:MAG TPA: translation initiation factor IF-2 [Elusimicrobia bacterium]|nr:translation initiation factor IF-2 [Elusimicrobiota bacterium]HBT61700.1 translation initiation factor IF-2 [Elusimicrobiota bacterium]
MEKKKAEKPAKDKVEKTEKTAKKAAKPAAPKKTSKGSHDKKGEKNGAQGILQTAAETRAVQEEGSIAPPSQNLVSAFDLFKKKKLLHSTGPTVTRLAAGASLPKPPKPEPPAADVVKPAPSPLPAPQAAAPAPAPVAKPSSAPAAKPAAAAPTVLPAAPSVAKPAVQSPTPPAAKPAVPPAPPRPVPPSVRTGPPAPRPPAGARFPAPGARPGVHRPAGPGRPAPKHAAAPQPVPAKPVEPRSSAPSAAKPALKKLQVSTLMTVRDLSEKMEVRSPDVIKKLMNLGIFATINQRLEPESASIVAQDFGYELDFQPLYKESEITAHVEEEKPESLKPRAPVVTVMGHVDHGKTTLLDAIRSTRVAEGESGGITQHIGAYRVRTSKGDIVFLDTPGHEAFTAMRARGAKVTDIVVVVVSATDGVMPQTVEALDHAKAADVPIVVAVNKVDLPGANPQKIRQELANRGIQPEEWGGKNIFVDVSAKKRLHIDTLLEMLALQAEMLDLKANPDRPAYGVVLEASLDPKKGVVANVLIQAGTIKPGDAFVAGLAFGKVKALHDDTGKRIIAAGPATPVEILGVINTPQAGDTFNVVKDERQAREIAERRALIHREQSLAHQKHMTLVGLKSQLSAGNVAAAKELKIVLKADVQGSLQALKDSLEGLSTSECRVRIIHGEVGNANESDVLLASASDAVTMLFHAAIDPRAEEVAAREGVEVRKYEIIYDLIADVKAALEGLLEPEIVEVIVGKGEIREIFSVKSGKVAGCMIRDGKAVRGSLVRIKRGEGVAYEGRVSTLKRFKDDVKEVEKGLECGMDFENFKDFQKGDQLEFYAKETRTRRLSSSR